MNEAYSFEFDGGPFAKIDTYYVGFKDGARERESQVEIPIDWLDPCADIKFGQEDHPGRLGNNVADSLDSDQWEYFYLYESVGVLKKSADEDVGNGGYDNFRRQYFNNQELVNKILDRYFMKTICAFYHELFGAGFRGEKLKKQLFGKDLLGDMVGIIQQLGDCVNSIYQKEGENYAHAEETKNGALEGMTYYESLQQRTSDYMASKRGENDVLLVVL